jgi:hypothetical protein
VAVRVTPIPVTNANGDELTVYEIWDTYFFGLIAERRFELETEERVEELDRDNFVVMRTGEKLTRVSSVS